MNKIYVQTYHSPCGDMLIGSYDDKLCLADWTLEKHRELIDRRLRKELKAETVEESTPIIEKTIKELNEYFAGARREFDLPLLLVGSGRDFNLFLTARRFLIASLPRRSASHWPSGQWPPPMEPMQFPSYCLAIG